MTLVLVKRDQLDKLLTETYQLRGEAGAEQDGPQGFTTYLHPWDPLVTLSVDAGLPLPGPMLEGFVPPPPPHNRFAGGTPVAACYRAPDDARLRCSEDAKVVYGTLEQAEGAARSISQRTPMLAYLGKCGHYHVARRKQ